MSVERELREVAALLASNALSEAQARCETVVRSNPGSSEALRSLALIENRLGQRDRALATITGALALAPDDHVNLNIRGVLLVAAGRLPEALEAFERACRVRPAFLPAILNRATALLDLDRAEEALSCLDQAAKAASGDPGILLLRGRALQALGLPVEALENLTRATALNPRSADTRLARAEALRVTGRNAEALAEFDAVLSFNPGNTLALQNSGTLLHQLGLLEQAVARYERLIGLLRPIPDFAAELDYALGMAVSCRRTMCAWGGMPELEAELIERVRRGNAVIKPHLSLMITDDPAVQNLCARRFWAGQFGEPAPVGCGQRPPHDRLRIGYLSSDFRDHPTSWLIAGLIESHDRDRFEVRGYSTGPDDESPLRRRIQQAFDHFTDISAERDEDAARRIAADEVDILVDLNGLTDGGRGGILARRPAPVVAHFLAYPGPLGTRAVDYIIADHVVVPDASSAHFDSAIVRLPVSYQVNDQARERPGTKPAREALGLPAESFVFCGFCQPVKLSPEVFDAWMRILARAPGSVLWLLEDNRFMRANLEREAQSRGVEPERLVFAPRVDQQAHIARHQSADLLLDTWPCGAHTSASDALWVGVPVITRPGATFASRVAASLLGAVGLPELVVTGLPAYEDLAVELARSPALVQKLRARLATDGARQGLFDTSRFRARLELAFQEMWRRHQEGRGAGDFSVDAP
ncbi:tetratricopeptide repeat protein [Reyranella sp.]|uniref:O-linked N-acetylglucosamine transferase, SPINDLY family protein n=1 Tax=Reyranella sp. TaxID=1929291 RepID=UPI003D141DC7